MNNITNTLEEIGRSKLKELLQECTNEEINLFNQMYVSVAEIPLEKMNWAIQQCERSIYQKGSRRTYTREREIKRRNLRLGDYKTGFEKLMSCKHSRKRLNQIKTREASHVGCPNTSS
ncbi:MAG: hypothetical protein KAS32_28375 [Candidatus Peribacteraceae bacterium]|nr:hypothetical protein [Candidatus Peribacteraceae bacterium]